MPLMIVGIMEVHGLGDTRVISALGFLGLILSPYLFTLPQVLRCVLMEEFGRCQFLGIAPGQSDLGELAEPGTLGRGLLLWDAIRTVSGGGVGVGLHSSGEGLTG